MTEMSLAERHVRESEGHVSRVVTRIEELERNGLTQAASEKRETLMILRMALAKDREYLRRTEEAK